MAEFINMQLVKDIADEATQFSQSITSIDDLKRVIMFMLTEASFDAVALPEIKKVIMAYNRLHLDERVQTTIFYMNMTDAVNYPRRKEPQAA